jgi:hypothetical protein
MSVICLTQAVYGLSVPDEFFTQVLICEFECSASSVLPPT